MSKRGALAQDLGAAKSAVVRKAAARDLQAINRVVEEAVLSWSLTERARRLALPSLLYDVADLEHMTMVLLEDAEGEGVAVAAWEEAGGRDAPPGTRALLLHGLYVVPRWQRRGLGTSLLEFAEDWARPRGCDGIALRAWRQSERFFRARGFRPRQHGAASELMPRQLWKPLP